MNDMWQWATVAAIIGATVSSVSALIAFRELRRDRRNAISLGAIIALRDLAIRNSLVRILSDDPHRDVFEQIDRAFVEGDKEWQGSFLDIVLGSVGRERLKALINSAPIGSTQGGR